MAGLLTPCPGVSGNSHTAPYGSSLGGQGDGGDVGGNC